MTLQYCKICNTHYNMEEFLNHSCHGHATLSKMDTVTGSTNTDSPTVKKPLRSNTALWNYLQEDLDFNDPVKMVIWSKFSQMKAEIELIQTKQIDNISGFYKSALAQNIQTNKMKLSWLLKNLHNYEYLKREKHRYRNQTTFIYFLPDIDPKLYEKLTSQYSVTRTVRGTEPTDDEGGLLKSTPLENHCKESKTITTSPPDSEINCKETFTIKPMPELTDEQQLVLSYRELTPAQIKIYKEKNPVFKRNYLRMKKEGLL